MRLHGKMTPDEVKDGGNNSTAPEGNSSGGGGGGGAVGTNRAGGSNSEDFSEFLWMEHQEEFDEQVLKELEDEEVMNFYLNMTEAENEAEEEANAAQNLQTPTPGAARAANADARVSEVTSELNQLGFASRLNPNAQEFVPQMRNQPYQSNSVPVSESGGS